VGWGEANKYIPARIQARWSYKTTVGAFIHIMKCYNCKQRKAFSLTEAMLATAILSMAAAGVLLPFTSGAMVRADARRQMLAARLAHDLMEDIMCSPWESIVDTWNGWSDPLTITTHTTGQPFTDPQYADVKRKVDCVYVYMPQESADGDPEFIRVTITVYHGNKEIGAVTRLVNRNGLVGI
jgi:hypothetical protein